jgi:hypothetical protein
MDYQMLSKIFTDTDLQQLTCEPPYYYEHPWSIKRNKYWPLDVDRKVVEHISLEKHLTMNVGINSLIYTGMTSSVILLCELVKQGRLSIGNLTLLLQEPAVLSKYQDPNELDSFINFIVRVYSESVKLTVWYNGKNIRA